MGEWTTTSLAYGKDNKIEFLSEVTFPHSLGLLYSAITYYTGFKVNSGEYKVMGLAPYGRPVYVETIKKHLIDIKQDGSFRLDMTYFDYTTGLKMTSRKFHRLFRGNPRKLESPITQKEMDLACSVQKVIEEILIKIAKHAYQKTKAKHLCLAGGVALNCVANGKLLFENIYDSIWVQPAAGDAGGALGAALATYYDHLKCPRKLFKNEDTMEGSYLGPSFTPKQAIKQLKSYQAVYSKAKNQKELLDKITDYLTLGKVIGWHQGRAEFGPRALGARSIIADPRNEKMQSILNLKIKYRESFRPFAPSILEEDVSAYFDLCRKNTKKNYEYASPYMLFVAPIHEKQRLALQKNKHLFGIDLLKEKRSSLPSITHVDYSARIQTVDQKTNPFYYALIKTFKDKTHCPIVINTSFNVRGEPIVLTPQDSYRCFMRTEMDILVIEDLIFLKEDQKKWSEKDKWQQTFALD